MSEDQDQSNHAGTGDLTTMTIESLRTRLLSERAISRTERQRADELSKRVIDLEVQLRIVSMQRKKAERATADVLAILESNGISDGSEAFDSSSDREMSVSESKVSNESVRRKEALTGFQGRRDDQDTYSSSEIDSSSTAGSLSWKSNKDSPNYIERKKYIESIRKRSSSFASSGSLTKRLGKSCRRIRRKESRAPAEQLRVDNIQGIYEDTVGADHHDPPKSPDISSVRKEPEKHMVKDLTKAPLSKVSGSPKTGDDTTNISSRNGHAQELDLEVAGQSQQTVAKKETEENAITECKDNLKENNSYVLDSYDPDSSNVTEDRDEIWLPNQSLTAEPIRNPNQETQTDTPIRQTDTPIRNPNQETQSVSVETSFSFNPEVSTYSPDTPQFSSVQKQVQKNGSMSTHESSSSDFAFPRSIGTHGQVLTGNHDSRASDVSHMHLQPASFSLSNVANGESSRNINEPTLIPQKPSNGLDSVLDALHLAKLSLKHRLSTNSVDESSAKGSEPLIPMAKAGSIIGMPVGVPPGLFRLPFDDLQFQKPSIVNYSLADSPVSLSNSYREYARDKSVSSPHWEPRPNAFAGDMFNASSSIRYADMSTNQPRPNAFAGDMFNASSSIRYADMSTNQPRPNAFAGDMFNASSSIRYADMSTNHTFPPSITGTVLGSGVHTLANASEPRSRTYTYTPQYMERRLGIYTGATPPIELSSGIPPVGITSFSTRHIDFAPTMDGGRLLPTERSTYMDPQMNTGYPFSSKYTYPSYPPSPDVTPQLSLSDRFSRDVRSIELGSPSNPQFSSYADQIRPNMYK